MTQALRPSLLALLVLAATASAATHEHSNSKEAAASALWFGHEPGAGPDGLDVFTTTGVFASAGDAGSVHVFRFKYAFPPDGGFLPLGTTFASGPASVTLDRALSSGAVDAVVTPWVCDADGACTEGAPLSIVASWAGSGPAVREREKEHFNGGGVNFVFQYQGRVATAAADGAWDGVPLGPTPDGRLSTAHVMVNVVCRAC